MMTGERQTWRDYQNSLKKNAKRKQYIKAFMKGMCFIPVCVIACYALYLAVSFGIPRTTLPAESIPESVPEPVETVYNKIDLHRILSDVELMNSDSRSFDILSDGKQLHIETSLDIELQKYLIDKIDRAKNRRRGHPRYLAFVAIDPVSGKIRAMAGYDKTDPNQNTCIESSYPAASIFKIVTAAAAVEECGLNPGSRLKFNGNKYTLYKNQLKERTNKYTNTISFKDSFAQSVNPVFGKLGALYLGRKALEKYASAFGFNQVIDFETDFRKSRISLSDEPYQWAEIACGFNRETLITPLHGALLSGAVINKGALPEPSIIEKVVDNQGNVLYSSSTRHVNQAVKPETSMILKKMMAQTITSGTGKKSFRGYQKDPVLKKLFIGGKTGSIYNKTHDVRFDWFVGFAEDKTNATRLAVSIVVGHEQYIGTKACSYARMVMKQYFSSQSAKNDTDNLIAECAQ